MALIEILRKSGIPYFPYIVNNSNSFVIVEKPVQSSFVVVEKPAQSSFDKTTGIPYSSFERVGKLMVDRCPLKFKSD